MAILAWHAAGAKQYETGVDKGVLYVQDNAGAYPLGVPWNGLINITESPEGAEPNPQYADNIKYLNLISAEDHKLSIEAFSSPVEFDECDGQAELETGVTIGQQSRKTFGLCYRTKIGTDLDDDAGYKIHIVYGCKAAPSEKAFASINESPEAITFSWDVSTTPVPVTGFKPTATIVIDSTKVDPGDLSALEDELYGTASTEANLPTPDEIIALLALQ